MYVFIYLFRMITYHIITTKIDRLKSTIIWNAAPRQSTNRHRHYYIMFKTYNIKVK